MGNRLVPDCHLWSTVLTSLKYLTWDLFYTESNTCLRRFSVLDIAYCDLAKMPEGWTLPENFEKGMLDENGNEMSKRYKGRKVVFSYWFWCLKRRWINLVGYLAVWVLSEGGFCEFDKGGINWLKLIDEICEWLVVS